MKEGKTTRKDFLYKFFSMIGGISGIKILIDIEKEANNKYLEERIFYELPFHIYFSRTIGKDITKKNKIEKFDQIGAGIILGKKYLTMAHITSLEKKENLIEKETRLFGQRLKENKLNGILLKEEFLDIKSDLAIYEIPKILKDTIPDFPCIPSTEINLGEKIYIIGNPQLLGFNIRKGYISDLNGFNGMEEEMNLKNKDTFFGVDTTIITGDSGCPVVNSEFKLLGFCGTTFHGLGYVKKINEYLEKINYKKPIPQKIPNCIF